MPDLGKPMMAKSNIHDISPMIFPFLPMRSLRGGIVYFSVVFVVVAVVMVTFFDGVDLLICTDDDNGRSSR